MEIVRNYNRNTSGINNLYILSYDNTSQNWKVTKNIKKMDTDLDLGLIVSGN